MPICSYTPVWGEMMPICCYTPVCGNVRWCQSVCAYLFAVRWDDSDLFLQNPRLSWPQQLGNVPRHHGDFIHVEERRTSLLPLVSADDAVEYQWKSLLGESRPAAQHGAGGLVGTRLKIAIVERAIWNVQDVGMRAIVAEKFDDQPIVVRSRRRAGIGRFSFVDVGVFHVAFQQRSGCANSEQYNTRWPTANAT